MSNDYDRAVNRFKMQDPQTRLDELEGAICNANVVKLQALKDCGMKPNGLAAQRFGLFDMLVNEAQEVAEPGELDQAATLLLEMGYDAKRFEPDALSIAASHGWKKAATKLLDLGHPANGGPKHDPLTAAIEAQDKQMVELLLAHGAEPLKVTHRETALAFASRLVDGSENPAKSKAILETLLQRCLGDKLQPALRECRGEAAQRVAVNWAGKVLTQTATRQHNAGQER